MYKPSQALVIFAVWVCSTVLISSLSIESTCYIEQRVRTALSANTNKAINDSLLLFLQKSLNESAQGSIQDAWSRSYVLQALASDLMTSTPAAVDTLTKMGDLFTKPSNTSSGYCAILTQAKSLVNSASGLTSDQRAELFSMVDLAMEIARGQSCNIWGQLYANPNYTQTLQAATSSLTFQQQSMLDEITGCNVNI